ncbi:MAG: hypothetical protein IVW53_15980, partial [Chloroflexi bacterium]|nr:hypothetical protein [Chloroflexota bacterium]
MMSYPPADAPKDVAELLSHRVEGETSDEDVDVDENMTQDEQDRPAALQGIPYTDDEPDAEGDHQQNQPHEQDQPCYTDEERLVWLEQRVLQYERQDAVHQADVDALAKRANKQTRLIKQIQELQNEDHPVLMSVASTTTRISQELRGISTRLGIPFNVPAMSAGTSRSARTVSTGGNVNVSNVMADLTGMASAQAQGSAPGQGTSSPESPATSSQAMHQSLSSGQGTRTRVQPTSTSPPATSTQARAIPEVSYAQAAGSASQWPPPAASPPDPMDFDQQPLPSGAMEPSRQEIVAAAQLLRRAAATQSIDGFVPAVGPRLTNLATRALTGTHVGSVPSMTSNDIPAQLSLPGPANPVFTFRPGTSHPSPLQATSSPGTSHVKVPMPDKFAGTDPQQDIESWIMQAARYIRLQNVPGPMQVDVAAACLTGSAAKAWHSAEQMLRQANKDVTSIDL